MKPIKLSTHCFTWHSLNEVFAADASDLQIEIPFLFILISGRTGKEKKVTLKSVRRHDGDILHWTFLPGDESFKVIIYND